MNFDDRFEGELPAGWEVAATHMKQTLATWGIATDSDGSHLALVKPNHEDRRTFNIVWTDEVEFLDGELSVRVRADSGKIDQGGGLVWRVQDSDNYYIARYNPLETNLRVYHVKDAVRTQLGDAANIPMPDGQWWTLAVRHHGNHIVVSLDGRDLLDVRDSTFTESGGIGLWTKADAATSFDDLSVTAK